MLTFLDQVFNHPFLNVAFGGFGVAIITLLFSINKKNKLKIEEPKPLENTTNNIITTLALSQIKKDIVAINRSINYDITSDQKDTYNKYYFKYKKRFNDLDNKLLIDEYEKQSYGYSEKYSILLNQLLGLIEEIDEE